MSNANAQIPDTTLSFNAENDGNLTVTIFRGENTKPIRILCMSEAEARWYLDAIVKMGALNPDYRA